MSARREDILNTFWDDEEIDDLGNSAVLLYIWSWTNQKCGMAGIYRCKRRDLCEGRLTSKQLDKALAELQAASLLYYIDGWLWVVERVKHLSAINPNIARAVVRDVENLPDGHEYKTAFVARYSDYGKLTASIKKPLTGLGLNKPHSEPSDDPPQTNSEGDGDGDRDGEPQNASSPATPLHSPSFDANVVATTRGQS